VKRTVQPYFVLQGNVCALLATNDHVNLFLYDGGLAPDPYGSSPRPRQLHRPHIAFYEGDPIPEEPLLALLRSVIADNRRAAGGGSSAPAEHRQGRTEQATKSRVELVR